MEYSVYKTLRVWRLRFNYNLQALRDLWDLYEGLSIEAEGTWQLHWVDIEHRCLAHGDWRKKTLTISTRGLIAIAEMV